MTEPKKVEFFRNKIIEWYIKNGNHDLPWRNTNDPWAILVATVLLRKTTVTQVLKVYNSFLQKYPTPKHLVRASISELTEILRPLGIEHERSRIFKTLAQELLNRYNGQVPCSIEELVTLPGIGRYAASEILLIAYGRPEPLLDRNMIRVFERFFGVKSEKRRPHYDRKLWSFAKSILPKKIEDAKAFNYGVLDFAKVICTAKSPHCNICTLKEECYYYNKGVRNCEENCRKNPYFNL